MPTEPSLIDQRRKAKAAACEQFLTHTVSAGLPVTEPRRNVVGVGIAPKMKGGKALPETAVCFYVERKVANESEVPQHHRLPKMVDAMPTDVVEIGQLRTAASAPAPAMHPHPHVVQPGTSCGVRFGRAGDGATGTVGAIVAKGDKRYLLSSAHVLARINGFLLGSPILCPGPIDLPALAGDAHPHGGQAAGHPGGHQGHPPAHGGTAPPTEEDFQCARLADLTPLSLTGPNGMDAAIAELIGHDFDPAIREIGRLADPTPMQAMRDMRVMKSGIATKLTYGRVIDTDFDGRLQFRQGTVAFEDQILIESDEASPFAWEGDSGALVVTRFNWETGRTGGVTQETVTLAVAQVVGFSMPTSNQGSPRTVCVATPLTPILQRLGVSLVC